MVPNYAFYPHSRAATNSTSSTSTATACIPERLLRNNKRPLESAASPLSLPLSEKKPVVPRAAATTVSAAMKADESTPLLSPNDELSKGPPAAGFARALSTGSSRHAKPSRLPQAIAHRGYKVAFPENTMAAFRSAVEIGAHAIESDLHLSKEGVVVLSHDPTLKRCFGIDAKVADYDWDYLSTLRTLRKPNLPMPRLIDLLEYLAQPQQEHVWLLLDVKRDDDASELLTRLAETIASVPARIPWNTRIILGCWNANYVRLSKKLLPEFPLAFIGWSLAYATALSHVPNMNFNLLLHSLTGPFGARFLRHARKINRLVFGWTVNEERWMEWSIQHELDGVITDDPKLFLEVCDRWRKDPDGAAAAMGSKTTLPCRVRQFAEAVVMFIILNTLIITLRTVSAFKRGSPTTQVRRGLAGQDQGFQGPVY
ncbi:hypothetical protein JX265_004446 [Neoarthrinium moseri]|uniref:GP-PDE domain-containing protein n=1 Tax=Neoarthrinium moseri TaxID=1658444 RepID=A0A9P9WQZ7_9PEZI|nr:uncharacterized protein JN550_010815 [Neoarthrinium moseri]KAI1850735.1 hypothetical protein JX266_004017 [Neoarthrinium moseri]KAI1861435.1 hypothetical protein JN550_010815 [Neoarthrinium moseri]KAI1875388.1 hypothetical protein JX265_004446 [Neoarthrinium moseri]